MARTYVETFSAWKLCNMPLKNPILQRWACSSSRFAQCTQLRELNGTPGHAISQQPTIFLSAHGWRRHLASGGFTNNYQERIHVQQKIANILIRNLTSKACIAGPSNLDGRPCCAMTLLRFTLPCLQTLVARTGFYSVRKCAG